MGFNCTFMELKYDNNTKIEMTQAVLIVPLWNWNSLSSMGGALANPVLIVPLWNWNVYRN